MADGSKESASELHFDNNGDRVVGGSLRADGTVRKTIKVRPGFTPAEDVKRYNVRERMRHRQQVGESKCAKEEEGERKPGTRPNRQFGAINNILQSNSSAKTVSADPQCQTEKEPDNTSDLKSSLEKLSLGTDETSPSSGTFRDSTRSKKPSLEPIPSSSKPATKKYIPPSRRKKYTLEDLDKS